MKIQDFAYSMGYFAHATNGFTLEAWGTTKDPQIVTTR